MHLWHCTSRYCRCCWCCVSKNRTRTPCLTSCPCLSCRLPPPPPCCHSRRETALPPSPLVPLRPPFPTLPLVWSRFLLVLASREGALQLRDPTPRSRWGRILARLGLGWYLCLSQSLKPLHFLGFLGVSEVPWVFRGVELDAMKFLPVPLPRDLSPPGQLGLEPISFSSLALPLPMWDL